MANLKNLSALQIILSFTFLKLAISFLTNSNYGFHRDEFLYLELGNHLNWGYWSNPPSLGFFSAISQSIFGVSVSGLRFFPALLGGGTVFLTGLIAREMGGKKFAVALACTATILSPAYFRVFLLYNPVPFDVFYWVLYSWLILKFINTNSNKYIILLGVFFGLGMLNKYSVAFYILATIGGLLISSHRKKLFSKYTFYAILITLGIFAPNLFWQYQHGFPVLGHMTELRETQLVHILPHEFLIDQIIFNFPSFFIIFLGSVFFFTEQGKKFRPLFWVLILTLFILFILKGKSYYTLGIYPALMAAGAVFLENWTVETKKYLRPVSFFIIIILMGVFLPISIPFLKPEKLEAYCSWMSDHYLEAPMRWEDGEIHPIPQDFADMFGWEQIAGYVEEAWAQVEDKENCYVMASGYWEAGLINHLCYEEIPEAVSADDSFRFWMPDEMQPTSLIYVNIEIGPTMKRLFKDIKIIGTMKHPLARENGTHVYLLSQPAEPFNPAYQNYLREIRNTFRTTK